ncbi:tRNA A64-2'-O-ribosylphosphate transferase, partial [Polyplosphaeria fusca]
MARVLTQSDLIFPTQSASISSALSSLKRSALSIHNRLSSITQDSKFVLSVAEAYNLPLVANERCGSWYIPPSHKSGSAYFKSTDGHTNEWTFSLRRLNYQVLELVGRESGCVIVDSTRRGKSMPDALSKTVPIWCCVINRALFPEDRHELYTSPQAVSEYEHSKIEERIEDFVKSFLEVCKPDVEDLRKKLQQPLRPVWVTQTSLIPTETPSFPHFHPVVLCTASRRVQGAEASEGGYIQGAADDHEAWAHGLTPKVFWDNANALLSTNEDEIPSLISELLEKEKGPEFTPTLVKPTSNLFISSSQNVEVEGFDLIISCTLSPLSTSNADFIKTKKYLQLQCQTNKLGSRDLRSQLQHLPSFFQQLSITFRTSILVCCPTGKDLSVGVSLAILCLFVNDDGEISNVPTGCKIDKTFIKQRLAWITTSAPMLNPSRQTLNAVNAFLMPDPREHTKPPSAIPSPITQLAYTAPEHSTPADPIKVNRTPQQIFSTLLNNTHPWTFTRTLTSALPTHPSGTVTGTAAFSPLPTTTTSPQRTPAYVYSEQGTFTTTTGLQFAARRKYIYMLKTPDDDDESSSEPYIAVYFHDEEERDGIGGLFVEMGRLQESGDGGLESGSRERHLCAEDVYGASWRFG